LKNKKPTQILGTKLEIISKFETRNPIKGTTAPPPPPPTKNPTVKGEGNNNKKTKKKKRQKKGVY